MSILFFWVCSSDLDRPVRRLVSMAAASAHLNDCGWRRQQAVTWITLFVSFPPEGTFTEAAESLPQPKSLYTISSRGWRSSSGSPWGALKPTSARINAKKDT